MAACAIQVRPGDRVQVTGIYRAAPARATERADRDAEWGSELSDVGCGVESDGVMDLFDVSLYK